MKDMQGCVRVVMWVWLWVYFVCACVYVCGLATLCTCMCVRACVFAVESHRKVRGPSLESSDEFQGTSMAVPGIPGSFHGSSGNSRELPWQFRAFQGASSMAVPGIPGSLHGSSKEPPKFQTCV